MKNAKLFVTVLITSIFLISCGGGNNTTIDGGVLGDLPIIANKTVNKLKALQEENANEKIRDKIKAIKKEAKTEMTNYIQSKDVFVIPFEQKVENEIFSIKEVKITKAHFQSEKSLKSSLVMTATCETVTELRGNLSLFLRFIDSNGKELEGWATLNYFGKPLKKVASGEEIVFNGAYTGHVEKLIKVTNVINISRDYWNELRRK